MILVLNCGSQSIKWKLFNEKLSPVKNNKVEILNPQEYQNILEEELKKLNGQDISTVGHRVVHGGDLFSKPLKITQENIKELEALNRLAPLHNPFSILGIKACRNVFGDKPNIAVFDTVFVVNVRLYIIFQLREFALALPANRAILCAGDRNACWDKTDVIDEYYLKST